MKWPIQTRKEPHNALEGPVSNKDWLPVSKSTDMKNTVMRVGRMFKTTWLSDFDGRRDNNFTAVRLLMAWLVLYGHSYAITKTGIDPISQWLGGGSVWIGALAVNGFFAISGFLVSASLQNRSLVDFVVARILRVYPAIIVLILTTVFVLGPLLTTFTLSNYFTHQWTLGYLNNISLWSIDFRLPGVFDNNPRPNSINGSLWSLPAEIRCYIGLAIIGFFVKPLDRLKTNAALLLVLIGCIFYYNTMPLFSGLPRFQRPLMFFIVGCLVYVNRSLVPLNGALVAGLIALVVIAKHTGTSTSTFNFLICVAFLYSLVFAVFGTPYLNLDKLGDWSYGVYIYAWPIQQLVWQEGQSALANTVFATIIVLPLSALSWTYLESPALRLKSKRVIIGRFRKLVT